MNSKQKNSSSSQVSSQNTQEVEKQDPHSKSTDNYQFSVENSLMKYERQMQNCKCSCHTRGSHEQNRQLQSMKLKQHLQFSEHTFQMQLLQNKLDELKYENDCFTSQNRTLKQFIVKINDQSDTLRDTLHKYQIKLRNQQGLIDEYKQSIEEQISLEKQVVKSAYLERQCQLRNQFEKALRDMDNNYHRKLKQCSYNNLKKQCKQDMYSIKKLCNKLGYTQQIDHTKQTMMKKDKENMLKTMGNCKQRGTSSSYSTTVER